MDAVSIEHTGSDRTEYTNSQGPAKAKVKRVIISDQHYLVEVFEDEFRQTWVKVRTGDYVSRPIPFRDFVVGNQ